MILWRETKPQPPTTILYDSNIKIPIGTIYNSLRREWNNYYLKLCKSNYKLGLVPVITFVRNYGGLFVLN